MNSPPRLILASSSVYRRHLLERLCLDFSVVAPDVDESALAGESPAALALRLACLKAATVSRSAPGAVVIGSDQVAECDGTVLGKPGSIERAEQQLLRLQGQTVGFHTAVCVTDGNAEHAANIATTVRMRSLDPNRIRRYVAMERPVDCAGAFKSEALGISLIETLDSEDPTALIGLPLIASIRLLAHFNIAVP